MRVLIFQDRVLESILEFCFNNNIVTTNIVYVVTKTCINLLKNFGLYHKDAGGFSYVLKEEDEFEQA